MKVKYVNMATDFSPFPSGRYITDGPYSGESFRKSHLMSGLVEADVLIICLDGVMGMPRSFVNEAFIAPIKEENITAHDFFSRVSILTRKPENQEMVDKIIQSILDCWNDSFSAESCAEAKPRYKRKKLRHIAAQHFFPEYREVQERISRIGVEIERIFKRLDKTFVVDKLNENKLVKIEVSNKYKTFPVREAWGVLEKAGYRLGYDYDQNIFEIKI